MAFLIGGANSAADTGFEVANSCRFNDDDTAYLHRTPGSEGNRKIWTFSCWFKRGNLYAQAGEMRLFGGNSIVNPLSCEGIFINPFFSSFSKLLNIFF